MSAIQRTLFDQCSGYSFCHIAQTGHCEAVVVMRTGTTLSACGDSRGSGSMDRLKWLDVLLTEPTQPETWRICVPTATMAFTCPSAFVLYCCTDTVTGPMIAPANRSARDIQRKHDQHRGHTNDGVNLELHVRHDAQRSSERRRVATGLRHRD